MVAPDNNGFLISDSGSGGYEIARYQAREKSLLGLPVLLAGATLAGVVFLLGGANMAFISAPSPDRMAAAAWWRFPSWRRYLVAHGVPDVGFGDVGRLADSVCLSC